MNFKFFLVLSIFISYSVFLHSMEQSRAVFASDYEKVLMISNIELDNFGFAVKILNNGFDVDTILNEDGDTSLILSVKKLKPSLVKLFLNFQANLYFKNNSGKTALDIILELFKNNLDKDKNILISEIRNLLEDKIRVNPKPNFNNSNNSNNSKRKFEAFTQLSSHLGPYQLKQVKKICYYCNDCKIFFDNIISCGNHFSSCHSIYVSDYKINNSLSANKNISSLVMDLNIAEQDGKLKKIYAYCCNACQRIFYTAETYSFHLAVYHPMPFFCSQCMIDFEKNELFQMHLVNHHNTAKALNYISPAKKVRVDNASCFSCKYCGEKFDNQGNLNLHEFEKHVVEEAEEQATAITTTVTSNISSPDTESNTSCFNCKYCGEKFDNQGNLNLHEFEKHVVEEAEEQIATITTTINSDISSSDYISCPICKEQFAHQADLNFHEFDKHFDL